MSILAIYVKVSNVWIGYGGLCPIGTYSRMARTHRFPPNRIRELREERGWSEAKLGALCMPPMTATQIDKREKGLTAVTMEDMHRIARALECHPGDLLPLPPVSAEERALVERYRELAEPERRTVFRMVDKLASAPD